jgi:hypothetical protein
MMRRVLPLLLIAVLGFFAAPKRAAAQAGWTPTSTTGAPDPRENHVAVWTGSKMIV